MDAPVESMVHGSKATPRQLPSLDRLLRDAACLPLLERHGVAFVTERARAVLVARRVAARAGALDAPKASIGSIVDALGAVCAADAAPRMRRVLNLTGTVIHTNLGRATLAPAALAHVAAVGGGTSNLEFDLDSGGRGDRDGVVEALLCELTGAEAATVVNNNAAAVLLVVAAFARGREVVVSRGELVEIGGAFRMPDVMASAGATLVEVGTTNRTHPADYERAIGERTALVMKVHASNYAVQGFTAAVGEAELARIARAKGVPLACDLGSGSLVDLSRLGLPREPMPQEMLAAGCDVVTFSGDKLLGGPQAGIVVGSKEAIGRIRRFPMKRALRMSKLPLAALEATLALYRDPDRLLAALPTLRDLTRPLASIRAQAEALRSPIAEALGPGFTVEVIDTLGQIGSGSLPIDRLPSAALAIGIAAGARHGAHGSRRASRGQGHGGAIGGLAAVLRSLPTPLLGRIADGRVVLDVRCLDDEAAFLAQLPALADLVAATSREAAA